MNAFVKFGELAGAVWRAWVIHKDRTARRRFLFLYRPYRWIRTWS